MPNIPTPRSLGVPHPTWWPNQYETYAYVKNKSDNGGGFIFAELGTGTGKTGIATALSYHEPILALVQTLGLLSQYGVKYNFDIIKGRQEYPCALTAKVKAWQDIFKLTPTAADCHFSLMTDCAIIAQCPYHIAKNIALKSTRAACTYRYIGVSTRMQERKGNIVLDEAHDAAEELISFNTFELQHKTLARYGLPAFPIPEYGFDNRGANLTPNSANIINTWAYECVTILDTPEPLDFTTLDFDPTNKKTSRKNKMKRTFTRLISELLHIPWFLKVDRNGFALQALSARITASKIFASKKTKLLMSATIGNPDPLANALGITEFDILTFPHPVPKQYRPIIDLDVPRMTKRNLTEDPLLFRTQVTAIYNWIAQFPVEWRGVILTTSYHKILQIDKYLSIILERAGTRRLIVQKQGQPVSELVQQFITDVQPSDIAIGTIQGWGTGLDLQGDLARWIAIAGVPHVNPTDEYAKARRQLDGGATYQRWVTYNAVVQAAGRVARGERDADGDFLVNYAALADGSATTKTAKKYYSEWFLDAIKENE